jgi:hypothetical protein
LHLFWIYIRILLGAHYILHISRIRVNICFRMFCRTGATNKTTLHKFLYLCRWPSYIRKVKWRKLSWHKLEAVIIKQETIAEFSCGNILVYFCLGGRQEAFSRTLKRTLSLEVEKSRISTVSRSQRLVTVLRFYLSVLYHFALQPNHWSCWSSSYDSWFLLMNNHRMANWLSCLKSVQQYSFPPDMIWCYMIWYDIIWYDIIWYDMVWFVVWYDMLNCNCVATRWQ